jgi:hypothetical protein
MPGLLTGGYHTPLDMYGLETFPVLGPAFYLLVTGVNQRRPVLHDDTYIRTFAFAVHSHLLDV